MSVYLVTYDLNRETDRPNITKLIRDNFAYAMLSESSYAVSTSWSETAVYEIFEPILDDDDTLYVITLARPYVGIGSEEVNDWLESQIPS